jgi:hypothetical protein
MCPHDEAAALTRLIMPRLTRLFGGWPQART